MDPSICGIRPKQLRVDIFKPGRGSSAALGLRLFQIGQIKRVAKLFECMLKLGGRLFGRITTPLEEL